MGEHKTRFDSLRRLRAIGSAAMLCLPIVLGTGVRDVRAYCNGCGSSGVTYGPLRRGRAVISRKREVPAGA